MPMRDPPKNVAPPVSPPVPPKGFTPKYEIRYQTPCDIAHEYRYARTDWRMPPDARPIEEFLDIKPPFYDSMSAFVEWRKQRIWFDVLYCQRCGDRRNVELDSPPQHWSHDTTTQGARGAR